jgi:hypothetical protein
VCRTYAKCAALLVALSILASPAAASAVEPSGLSSLDAQGLTAGPFITDAGLIWESSNGIMLTTFAGRSTVLTRPDAPNGDGVVDLAWFGREWWALARPSGLFAGRIGGKLRALPLPGRCDPGSRRITPGVLMAQYAVSGEQLYAALPRVCLARRAAPFGEVVDVDLRSRRWHVLTPMPGTLDYMAASGRYLALAYWRSTQPTTAETRPFMRVLDAATGAQVSQITPPPSSGQERPSRTSGIQVDDNGDVLVTEGCCGAPPGQLAHVAQPLRERSGWWWARAGSKVGLEIHLGDDAVLFDGRVAFLEGRTLDVRNLVAATTRPVVTFTGSASASSLAFSGNELAWAQQSSVLNVLRGPAPGGGSFESCTSVALSPVELASVNLRDVPSSPIVVRGVSVPPQYANEPPCIEA